MKTSYSRVAASYRSVRKMTLAALLLIMTTQVTAYAQSRVTRDANGYAQWPHTNYDGIQQPIYRPDVYPGEAAKWSMSTSDDPAMVIQYRRYLEWYDAVHGTDKNPYPPLPAPAPTPRQAYSWGWRR